MPTISHAISHFVSQSSVLTTMLTHTMGPHEVEPLSVHGAQRITSLRLWQLLQEKLYDTRPPKRLKPILLTHEYKPLHDDLFLEDQEDAEDKYSALDLLDTIEGEEFHEHFFDDYIKREEVFLDVNDDLIEEEYFRELHLEEADFGDEHFVEETYDFLDFADAIDCS